MANTTAIRVALVRKLVEGGHRLRVEHILQRLNDRDVCSLLRLLPEREARTVAGIILGASGEASAHLATLSPAVIAAAVRRLEPEWAAAVLRALAPEAIEATLGELPRPEAEALCAELARPRSQRRRWPWRRRNTDEIAPAVI